MEEQFISLETAVLAKEKGFNIETFSSYIGSTFFENEATSNRYDGWDLPKSNDWNKKSWVFSKDGEGCFGCKLDNIKYFEACSAPTQSLLQKWLREVHKIHIDIQYLDEAYGFFYKITTIENNTESDNSKGFKTYEEALEIGLFESLKLI